MLTGYRVTQRASASGCTASWSGKAIAAAVDAGGNGVQVSGAPAAGRRSRPIIAPNGPVTPPSSRPPPRPSSTPSDRRALGQVVSIREVGGGGHRDYRPQFGMNLRAAYDAELASALPIRAGKDELKVRIEVVWTFE